MADNLVTPSRRELLTAAVPTSKWMLLARHEMTAESHALHMRAAITAALKNPRLPFGAVLVDGSVRLLSDGHNQSSRNPILHGEMDCMLRYADRAGGNFQSTTLYSTAEPCAMCLSAAIWCGIQTVVFGTSISFLKRLGLGQIDISADELKSRVNFARLTLMPGMLEPECNELFQNAATKYRWKR